MQLPKKSISENKYHPDTTLAEVANDMITIVRIQGGMRHRLYQKHFWFALVNQDDKTHVFSINPGAKDGKDREVLKAEVDGYSLYWLKEYVGNERREPVPIKYFLNEMVAEGPMKREYDFASSDKIDVMFGGSPEVSKQKAQGLRRLLPARVRA